MRFWVRVNFFGLVNYPDLVRDLLQRELILSFNIIDPRAPTHTRTGWFFINAYLLILCHALIINQYLNTQNITLSYNLGTHFRLGWLYCLLF